MNGNGVFCNSIYKEMQVECLNRDCVVKAPIKKILILTVSKKCLLPLDQIYLEVSKMTRMLTHADLCKTGKIYSLEVW